MNVCAQNEGFEKKESSEIHPGKLRCCNFCSWKWNPERKRFGTWKPSFEVPAVGFQGCAAIIHSQQKKQVANFDFNERFPKKWSWKDFYSICAARTSFIMFLYIFINIQWLAGCSYTKHKPNWSWRVCLRVWMVCCWVHLLWHFRLVLVSEPKSFYPILRKVWQGVTEIITGYLVGVFICLKQIFTPYLGEKSSKLSTR